MRTFTYPLLMTAMLFVLTSFNFSGLTQSSTTQFTEYGIATYYSDLFEGRSTSSGEPYTKTKLTAAHKSLPYGTIVKVTRLDNKKSIKVKINDRGAFNKGRIIDLSRAAARKLGMIEDGKANVKIVVVKEAPSKDITAINKSPIKKKKKAKKKAKKNAVKNPKAKSAKVTKKPKNKYHIKGSDKKSEKKPPAFEIVTKANYQEFDLYKVQVLRPKKEGFGVQVGLLENYENVFKFIADLQDDFFKNILLSVESSKSGPVYRVILGPFPSKEHAQSYRNSLAKKKKINGFVIGLDNLDKSE